MIAVSRQNLAGVAILARKDSSIHSLQDLRGKRAAIWKGSWSQQLLFSALDKAGVPATPSNCATSAPSMPLTPWMAVRST